MPEVVQRLWTHQAGDQPYSIAISSDGSFVVVGSRDKQVYFFARSGQLLWKREAQDEIFRLTLAEGRRRVLVGCTNGKAYQWDYEGHLLREYQTDGFIWGMGITPNADLIAFGTTAGSLFLFDEAGTRLWQYSLGAAVMQLSITPNGQYIATGSEDRHIYLFDRTGNLCWRYKTGEKVWAGARIAAAKYIVAGSNDHNVYLLDHNRHLLWKYDTGANIDAVTITPDGRYIAAAGNANTVFLLSNTGERLWSYKTGGYIYDLSLSADGRFLVAGSNDNYVYLFNEAGNCIWKQQTNYMVQAVAITPNGRLFTAASRDNSVYVFENLAAPEDYTMPWLVKMAFRRIRHAYATNPQLGVAYWFEEFDRSLLQRDFVLCQALLLEAREEAYSLSEKEHIYVDSREGAFLLCQGINYHQQGNYQKARQHYEKSRFIHHRLHDHDAEAQVDAALSELDAGPARHNPEVLASLAANPMVRGDSPTVLAERISVQLLSDQFQAVLAAKQSGYLLPLLKALSSNETSIQAAAATALAWLKPGPDYETVINMLVSPNWVVRWQATVMLQRRASKEQDEFAPHQGTVRNVVSRQLTNGEADPTVRCEMASLLRQIGDRNNTLALISLLSDRDPDVRFAAIEALAQIGDRRALPALHQVLDGKDFKGYSIHDKAYEAIKSIENRYTAPRMQKIVFCRALTPQQEPVQPATVFLAHEPLIQCVVTIEKPNPDTQVTCDLLHRGQRVDQQVQSISGRRDSTQRETMLIELLNEEDLLPTPPLTNVVFRLPSQSGGWPAGPYSVQITIDGEAQGEQSFKVIQQVLIEQVVTCTRVNDQKEAVDKSRMFLAKESPIQALITLTDAPIGLEISAQIYRGNSLIAEKRGKTEREGKQSIVHSWQSAQWPVGQYDLIVKVAGSQSTYQFQIVARTNPLLVSTLICLPLFLPLLAYSISTVHSTLPVNKIFDWLLVGAVVVTWITMGIMKMEAERFNDNRDELGMAGVAALLIAATLVFTLLGKSAISLSAILLLAALVGITIGIAGGITNIAKYTPLATMDFGFAVGIALITAFIATQWAFGLVHGGFWGVLLAIPVFLIVGAAAILIVFVIIALILFLMAINPVTLIITGLVSAIAVGWLVGLRAGAFVGLAYFLAIGGAGILRKYIKTKSSPSLKKGIAIILVLAYSIQIWIYFFGGWATLIK